MASSPKKAHRPAVKHGQPPLATGVGEDPTVPPASDVSTSALQAAEVLPPVDEPLEPAPAELMDPPVDELEPAAVDLAPPVAEAAPPPAIAAEPEPAVELTAAEAAAPLVEATAAANGFGDDLRALAEKSLTDSRAKFAEVKAAAEQASAAVEASYGAARDGFVAFNLKAIEALKAGANANFDHAASLASAKSVSELVSLQSEFARKQFEEASAQAKALAELARKVADESLAPIKAQVAKTFKIAV
jgi:phasin